MVWWQIVIVVAAVFTAIVTAFVEIYIRYLPERRTRNQEKHLAKVAAKMGVGDAINRAKNYKALGRGIFEGLIANVYTLEKTRRKLRELQSLAQEYENWRYEAWRIISTKAEVASKSFEDLDASFRQFFRGGIDEVFGGMEGSSSEGIYKAIYEGNLTFELARDSIMKDRWDEKVKITDTTSGGTELKLKDVVEGKDFHKLVEELKGLQDRESIKMLRDAQRRFLERAEAILKEVS